MTSAVVIAPLVLAVVLALAAVAKLRAPGSLLSSMRSLRLPGPLADQRLAQTVPYAELALAAALLLMPGPPFVVVATATLVLMLVYWGLIARGLMLDPRPSCGCFGAIGSPIGARTLARNTLLVSLAVVTWWSALEGRSTLGLLSALDGAGWAWLALAGAAALTTWFVTTERTPVRPATVGASPSTDTHDPQSELDFVREPIPHAVLLGEDHAPTTLRALAEQRAQLLLWVTCACARSQAIVSAAPGWRASMPLIDVRLVSTADAQTTRSSFPDSGEEFLYDHDGTAFSAVGFGGDPGALLLGADGLTAGGPVAGQQDVEAFVRDVQESLAQASGQVATDSIPSAAVEVPDPYAAQTGRLSGTVDFADGSTKSFDELAAGRRLLVLLLSQHCEPCRQVAVLVDDWASRVEGDRHILVAYAEDLDRLTDREVLGHTPTLAGHVPQNPLADFGLQVSPAAVVLDGSGVVWLGPVVGAAEVVALADRFLAG